MLEFKDKSSYSQDETKREPTTWEASVLGLRLCVTRHIDYGPDVWLLKTYPALMPDRVLKSKEAVAAQKEAVQLVRLRCQALADAMVFTPQLDESKQPYLPFRA